MKKIAIEYVSRDDVILAEYNPRTMLPSVMERLKKGIIEYGIVDPIIINKDGTVIGGHQRIQAAIELGHTEFPCVRIDVDKRKEKALNIALNKLSGEWDYTKLSVLLTEFETDAGFDIELTGFDGLEALEISSMGDPIGSFGLPGEGSVSSGGLGDALAGPDVELSGKQTQYVLIFNDESERMAWNTYLNWVGEKYPDEESVSTRITRDILERLLPASEDGEDGDRQQVLQND